MYTYCAILGHLQVVPSDNANISVLSNDDEVQALMLASHDDTEVAECVFKGNAIDESVRLPILSAYCRCVTVRSSVTCGNLCWHAIH